MAIRPDTESEGEVHPPVKRRRRTALPSNWRRFGSTALVGYAIVLLFGTAYTVVRYTWPDVPSSTAVMCGVLAAGPLALALVWERLTGLKFLGVEVTLAQAVVLPDRTLDIALSASEPQQQYFSGNREIWELVDRVIEDRDIELLEINLRTKQYWWSTRLFLQAALADDYTHVQQLVFVEGDAQRRYVGMATPREVRRAFAELPGLDLEHAYCEIKREARQKPASQNESEVRRIVERWAVHSSFKDGQSVNEEAIKSSVSAGILVKLVKLERESVEWDQPLDSALLQALVLEKGVRFVPLTQNGRLQNVVNADAFARQVTIQNLRTRLR